MKGLIMKTQEEFDQNAVDLQNVADELKNKSTEADEAVDLAQKEVDVAQEKVDSSKGAALTKAKKVLRAANKSLKDATKQAEEAKAESDSAQVKADEAQAEAKANADKVQAEAAKAENQKAPVAVPHHVAFFEQYLDNINNKRPDMAIASLNNCLKHMLSSGDSKSFDEVYYLFKDNKMFLTSTVMLQGAAKLTQADRAKVETISTIFHVLLTHKNPTKVINVEHARNVIKDEKFINWLAKKMR